MIVCSRGTSQSLQSGLATHPQPPYHPPLWTLLCNHQSGSCLYPESQISKQQNLANATNLVGQEVVKPLDWEKGGAVT